MLKLSLFNLLILAVVRGQYTNITVDDGDGGITYTGSWHPTQATPFDYPFQSDSSHGLCETATSQSSCTATFSFNGVAVYYWSPLWPYLVNSMLSLDGAPGECVNLRDPTHSSGQEETIKSMPVWGRNGLSNTRHTLVVSSCANGPYVVVDAFTYSTQLPPDSTSTSTSTLTLTSPSPLTAPVVSSSSSAAFSSSSSTPNAKTTRTRTIAIAVGGAVGGSAVLAILVILFFFCSRRRGPRAESSTTPGSGTWQNDTGVLVAGSPVMSNATLQPGVHHTQQNIYFNPMSHPNNQYDPNAPFNRQNSSSPESYYPKTLTTISEGSDIRRPYLPEL